MKKIHLIAPAGSLQSFYHHLGVTSAEAMISLLQDFIGPTFELTANQAILDANEDEQHGGRQDDDARAMDITSALADDTVTAIIAVRGGAWFTRILNKIDFPVLDRRQVPITVFGFSEMTPFVNIVAGYPSGRGIHDGGPAFLVYGLKYAAERSHGLSDHSVPTSHDWMKEDLRAEIRNYFHRTIRILQGHYDPIKLTAQLMAGEWPTTAPQRFVGGNLTVLSTLIGSRLERFIDPAGKWLVLEDFNDKLERFDRFLSHFTLAGFWEKCGGLLLGDFHRASLDLNDAILEIVRHHIPIPAIFPIMRSNNIGHVWPMVPLPLNHAGHWTALSESIYEWRPSPMVNSPTR